MARRLTTGFELGEIIEHNGSLAENGANFTVVTSPVRTGAYAAKNDAPAASSGLYYAFFSHVLSDNPAELYVRLALRHDGFGTSSTSPIYFLDFLDGSTHQISVGIRPSDHLLVVATNGSGNMGEGGTVLASGSIVLGADRWYVIEVYVKADPTNGQVIVKVNGITDITYSGNTAPSGNAQIGRVDFGANSTGLGNNGANLYFDDIAVNDTAGSYQNSWIGQGGVYLLKPTADGAQNDWTPTSGTTNWDKVDEIPKNTTDWVQAQSSGSVELYELEDLPAEVKTVDLVEVVYQVALSQAGYNEVQDLIRWGTTNYAGTIQPVTTEHPNYALYKGTVWYTRPDGTAWGTADVAALQAGYQIP